MFHWAPPEVNGLGVMTSTSSFTRSSQVWMFLGLPLRTANTTIELLTKPLVGPDAQFALTMPGSTSRSMSGASERASTSASRPASTARLWSPDGP